jgi:Zn ribbon nucleic-acid-binding protein
VALRANKPALIDLLRRAGGRIATFPHCPHCASYALYRENNRGEYECETCGLQNIEEQIARRLQ